MFCIDRETFMYQCAHSMGLPFVVGIAFAVAVIWLALSLPRGRR
jgi:hypothetical protein